MKQVSLREKSRFQPHVGNSCSYAVWGTDVRMRSATLFRCPASKRAPPASSRSTRTGRCSAGYTAGWHSCICVIIKFSTCFANLHFKLLQRVYTVQYIVNRKRKTVENKKNKKCKLTVQYFNSKPNIKFYFFKVWFINCRYGKLKRKSGETDNTVPESIQCCGS